VRCSRNPALTMFTEEGVRTAERLCVTDFIYYEDEVA